MMKRSLVIFLPLTLLILFSLSIDQCYAQRKFNRKQILRNNKHIRNFRGKKNFFNKGHRYNYFGVSVNALNYFGDLTPKESKLSSDISLTKPGFGLHWGHRFGPRYTLWAGISYGTIRGDDFESADPKGKDSKFRYVRNLQFRNRIKEFSVRGIFDLWENEGTYISRVKWTPYVFVGAAVFHHNPQAKVNENSSLPEAGNWVDLRPLGTEGQYSNLPDTAVNYGIKPYKQIQLALTPGIGIRFRLNEVLDLAIESSVRYTFTDYLDDVSANYVDLAHLNSDLARQMSDRSREPSGAVSDKDRDIELVVDTGGIDLIDKGGYQTFRGYGNEHPDNNRGNKNDNDIYVVTSIRLSYVIGGSIRRAKFR